MPFNVRRRDQLWIMDAAAKARDSTPLTVHFVGSNLGDMNRIARRTFLSMARRKETIRVAEMREELAKKAEEEGHLVTARRNYRLAASLYFTAQHGIHADASPEKKRLYDRLNSCHAKVIKYADYPMEKIEIPFEGKTIPAILHLVPGKEKSPCVVRVPGMDSCKENHPDPENNYFLKNGMSIITFDGPGQGECNIRGIKITIDNMDKAGSAVIDYLMTRPEIDHEKIALLGGSMGSYWAPRIAAYESERENRLKACGATMACWEPGMKTIFNLAAPTFKMTFMYMAGINDEDEFDEFAKQMTLVDIAPKIKCPMLLVTGEYDDLCPLSEAYKFYDLLKSPKEIVVVENQLHPLGGAVETAHILYPIDWIKDRLDGKPLTEKRVFLKGF